MVLGSAFHVFEYMFNFVQNELYVFVMNSEKVKPPERRVLNIDRDAFLRIRTYCQERGLSMTHWCVIILLKEIETETKL